MKADRVRILLLAALVMLAATASAESAWDDAAARLRAASLPAEQVAVIVEQARARGVAPRNVDEWAEGLGRLAQSGIPPAIAGERLAQGLAKGVPVERLDRALAELYDNLGWLNGLLGRMTARVELRDNPGRYELALRAGEAALRAGLDRAALERILGTRPLTLEQVSALSHAAGSLRAANIDQHEIVRALDGSGKAGIGAGEIARLERRFVAALTAGQSAQVAFQEFKASVRDLLDEAARSEARAAQREALQEEMRETMRGPGGLDMRPGGGVSPGAGHSRGLR